MRPFVFINCATTADGKLAPANRKFIPFGSKRDLDLLYRLRAQADAVIVGARTVDSAAGHYGPGAAKYRRMRRKAGLAEYNLRVLVTGAGTLDPRADIFRHRFGPIVILTTERAPAENIRRLRAVADEVKVFGKRQLDFAAALEWLRRERKVKRLLCEGGGELNMAMLERGLVDEIYLTICPLVFGGRTAPTLADGAGVIGLKDAIDLQLKSLKRAGQELFLVYGVEKGRGRKSEG